MASKKAKRVAKAIVKKLNFGYPPYIENAIARDFDEEKIVAIIDRALASERKRAQK